jgi:hypothetical protein
MSKQCGRLVKAEPLIEDELEQPTVNRVHTC